ncbi:YraN family protein [Intrasporangium sp. DVR]|uniref:YraN family protein n=1 Tax=Intrasporangium sp. DVR TaxID=3127867 RepID=UPI00313A745A
MDTPPTRALGAYGEALAARYLSDSGFTILDRNWRCARGEIDIVAREADALVVCEVKTRRTEQFGAPFEAVTREKLRRLRRLALLWLDARPRADRRRLGTRTIRIDVISILRPHMGTARLTHLRGVQ